MNWVYASTLGLVIMLLVLFVVALVSLALGPTDNGGGQRVVNESPAVDRVIIERFDRHWRVRYDTDPDDMSRGRFCGTLSECLEFLLEENLEFLLEEL